MTLPLRLPGAKMTSIIEMKVAEKLDKFDSRVHAVIPDGIFPGTSSQSPSEREQSYIFMTEAVQDIPLLALPDYVEGFKAGIYPPLQSPRWVQALSVPATFKEMQRDFMRLLSRGEQ